MKYLKISSLLVLSLLLFAPAALADVECELRRSTAKVRAESTAEPLGRMGAAVGVAPDAMMYYEFRRVALRGKPKMRLH